ncbi:MAG: hypothetical protein LLG24_09020 [Actinomycetia bacterium]|nr:hypothetical protein [Actinomycetes bacterium]
MRPVRADGSPWRFVSALGWSVTWAAGAGIGVALGGYLNLTSATGAPGVAALDPVPDLVLVPLATSAGVVVVYVLGSLGKALVLNARTTRRDGEQHDE